MKTEEKAKVVASVWGPKFIPILAALAILPRMILKNRINSSPNDPVAIQPIIQIFLGNTASATRNLINSYPQTEATTFAFSSLILLAFNPSSVVYSKKGKSFNFETTVIALF